MIDLDKIKLALEQSGTLFFVANAIVVLCTVVIILAIVIDFERYHKERAKNKKKINSWVETGSMFLYFFIYYVGLNLDFGRINIASESLNSVFQITGIILIIAGTYVNVKGRFDLKQNWSNQIVIYKNHSLISRGVYKYIRHPLYASLIWMFTGACFVYINYIALSSVFLIFVPMMSYRAKLEEKALRTEFAEYAEYKKKVWRFIPKFFKL